MMPSCIEMMASKWWHRNNGIEVMASKWWHRNDESEASKWWHRNDGIEMVQARRTGLTEPGMRKHQKSITYRRFSECVFEKPRNLIKPMEDQLFRVTENRCQKPYKTNCVLRLFPTNPKKSSGNIGKALPTQGFRNAFPRSRGTL